MSMQKVLLVGGAGILTLYLLSQKPAADGFGGAGGEGVEKKEPKEGGESDTVFITTTEKAESISGKKDVTASEAQWESLFETVGEYTPPSPGYLATGSYERYADGRRILGPTHPESPYTAIMTGKKITTHEGGVQTYSVGSSTVLVPGTWEKAYLAGQHARAAAGQAAFSKQQAFKKRLAAST